MAVLACLKPVRLRVEVDLLDGTVTADERSWGLSAADRAALEIALRIATARGTDVTAVSVGPAGADPALRDAVSAGAALAVRIDMAADAPSSAAAAALASVGRDHSLVVCGDQSLDRGSGAVPAFLAARLGYDQALGCTAVDVDVDGGAVKASRRTDRGGRDVIAVADHAVLSVEGAVARQRRAPLPATIGAGLTPVDLREGLSVEAVTPTVSVSRPFRPRARPAAPTNTPLPALGRIVDLTDAMTDRTPPRLLELTPADAAAAIVDQLRAWGYLEAPSP